MIKNYIEKANFEDTGFSYTLSLIAGNPLLSDGVSGGKI